jgi:hypothetical protein
MRSEAENSLSRDGKIHDIVSSVVMSTTLDRPFSLGHLVITPSRYSMASWRMVDSSELS